MSNAKKDKIIVIIGPTASGKTSLAVDLAYKLNGEIISADSRQVYKYMDVGTGKDLDEYNVEIKDEGGKIKNIKIPYHLIDVVSPSSNFNLGKYYKKGEKALNEILDKDKLPIIAGGSGLYAQALVEGYDLSKVSPDLELRKKLEKLSVDKLYKKLVQLDRVVAGKLNNSDKNNPRRLIRYIEILKSGEKIFRGSKNDDKREFLVICLCSELEKIEKRIYKRLIERLEKENMIKEVENLHFNKKVSWKKLKSFGLEYKYISQYLLRELNYEDMVTQLYNEIFKFSKRQITWFKRWERQGRKIYWTQNKKETLKIVKDFLNN